jgi:hypothetical protein
VRGIVVTGLCLAAALTSLAATVSLATPALAATTSLARPALAAQEAKQPSDRAGAGVNPSAKGSVSDASRRPRVIQDPRLEADSTLFPYEWPALNHLQGQLSRLRPELAAGNVAALAAALPQLERTAEELLADSLPSLLRGSREELRGRMIALQDALRRAAELAPDALAAPPAATPEIALVPGGEGAVELQAGAEVEEQLQAPEPATDVMAASPADSTRVGQVDSTSHEQPDSMAAEAAPAFLYLDAWLDVFAHADAILHVVRRPTVT